MSHLYHFWRTCESGQIKADLLKVQAVAEWPTPSNCKQLPRFLGFANFYRRFILNFSRVVAPLTCLISTKLKFTWSEEAEQAF